MGWLDDLKEEKESLRKGREEKAGISQEVRTRNRLEKVLAELPVKELLEEMNEELLDGKGEVEVSGDLNELAAALVAGEEVELFSLSWSDSEAEEEESGWQISLWAGLDEDGELYLAVEGEERIEIEPVLEELQEALKDAFRDPAQW